MNIDNFKKDLISYLNKIPVEELIEELEAGGVEFEEILNDVPIDIATCSFPTNNEIYNSNNSNYAIAA